MKSTSKEVLAIIPDFEEFIKLTEDIAEVSFQKLVVEKEIKEEESKVIRECFTNPAYFQGGKPPSMSYVENTYKYTGFENSIIPLREKFAALSSSLDKKKLQMSVYRDMLEVWRTLSANERNSSIQ